MSGPSLWTVAFRSLLFFLRTHVAIAFGVAAATAVLVGALLVGDSVRGSLRKLVIDRLANVECLLHARVFFDPSMVNSIDGNSADTSIAPAIIFSSATVEKRSGGTVTRASKIQILAVNEVFWNAVQIDDRPTLEFDQVAINQALADELGLAIGDEVTLRVDKNSGVPNDNPLGKREGTSESLPRQELVAILPDESVGGINFRAGQSVPRNVFASLETMQDVLECGPLVNAAIVLNQTTDDKQPVGQQICDELNLKIRPSLEDYELQLARHRRVFPEQGLDVESGQTQPPKVVYDYYQLSSSSLIIDQQTSTAIVNKVGRENAVRLVAYLVNGMAKIEPVPGDLGPANSIRGYEARNRDGVVRDELLSTGSNQGPGVGGPVSQSSPGRMMSADFIPPDLDPPAEPDDIPFLSREVTYSFVVGVDRYSELGLIDYLEVDAQELRMPYCWINSWLAKELELEAGDWFQASFYEPETVDGKEVEEKRRFMVAGIVPITEPVSPYARDSAASYADLPTVFNDPALIPTVPGVSDQDSISKWDTPFKLEKSIDPVDDTYWKNHRLTPKVFFPYRYAASDRFFGSRFGRTTSIRFPADRIDDEDALRRQIEEALLSTRALKGLAFLPVRQQQVAAASGTTPFDMLFLSLSFFVIVAAILLVFLLFKLGIQSRHSELGILLAQGFSPARVRGLLLREFLLVAIVGALLGIALGIGYARLMIAGLETWWIGAIATRFLVFFASPLSLAIGAICGMLASLLAIYLGLNRVCKLEPLTALRGSSPSGGSAAGSHRVTLSIACFAAIGAIGLIIAGVGQSGMARAGSFFGSGMLLLAAALAAFQHWIQTENTDSPNLTRQSLMRLAWSTIGRNPVRSTLALGLLSVATFLIASMGVFQIAPSEKGYGGFNLLAETSQPIYRNIGFASVRSDVLGPDARMLSDASIVPFRARVGEDASCNNLFQVSQPTILGVSPRLKELHDFAPDQVEFEWAATYAGKNPWSALFVDALGTERKPIPVIIDQNTAAWSLKQGASLGAITKLELGERVVHFKTVGLLSNSVLQGKLLIGQPNFEKQFPEINGFNFFMINSGKQQEAAAVAETLESGWSDEGMDVKSSSEILAQYLSVQNTYISAFQSLGALGLLLGTFGLVAVQVRSVIERRREFALMSAIGFAPSRIAGLLTIETAILLGGGLLTGVLCAAVALVPYIIETGPQLSLLSPIIMLVVVVAIGFFTALIAVRVATKQSVLDGLRSQ